MPPIKARFIHADATRLPLADDSVHLVVTSPPYMDARTYGIDAHRGCEEWIDWMLQVVRELRRVCTGAVVVNCAGVTRNRCYWPGPEGLLYRAWREGIECYRPCYWHRVGIPGSGGTDWYRADVEYVLCFKRPGALPHANPKANGHKPRFGPGGAMSHRLDDGSRVRKRVNRTDRYSTGERAIRGDEVQLYRPPAIANPGNLLHIKVGGGLMGHPLAHENEAPFPQKLPEFFIRSHSRPGDTVLDPFSGSGTTVAAAVALGRNGIGCDLRMSQCELGRRRVDGVQVELFAAAGGGT